MAFPGKWMVDVRKPNHFGRKQAQTLTNRGASQPQPMMFGTQFCRQRFHQENNGKLTNINLNHIALEIEPIKNVVILLVSHRT
jgi:hypothetical protein